MPKRNFSASYPARRSVIRIRRAPTFLRDAKLFAVTAGVGTAALELALYRNEALSVLASVVVGLGLGASVVIVNLLVGWRNAVSNAARWRTS